MNTCFGLLVSAAFNGQRLVVCRTSRDGVAFAKGVKYMEKTRVKGLGTE